MNKELNQLWTHLQVTGLAVAGVLCNLTAIACAHGAEASASGAVKLHQAHAWLLRQDDALWQRARALDPTIDQRKGI